jgi:hypothetical protein
MRRLTVGIYVPGDETQGISGEERLPKIRLQAISGTHEHWLT